MNDEAPARDANGEGPVPPPVLMERSRTAPALLLALGLVAAAWVLGASAVRIADSHGTLTVSGSARQQARAELVLWRGTFATEAPTLRAASAQLAWCRERVQEYLAARGVAPGAVSFSAPAGQPRRARGPAGEGVPAGFRLAQQVEVRSADVARVEEAAGGVAGLLAQGVPFESQAPELFPARASALEAEVLALATRDARTRALAMAKQGGARLGRLRSARVESFRVAPGDSAGADLALVELTAVVTASFEIL